MRSDYLKPIDYRRGVIDMNHGAGGRVATQLVKDLFVAAFDNPWLSQGDDAAQLDVPADHCVAMATDAHVISPLVFPGGNIGSLAVHGTINDIAMLGAMPRYFSVSFVLEEGFALAELKLIVKAMAHAASEADVAIVTGDTKVVERGKGDGVFITSSGIGILPKGRCISGSRARPGDAILLSGSIGDHGMAIMACRESLSFDTTIESDSAALHWMTTAMLDVLPEGAVHVLRDPTRGGLATTLNEIAEQSAVGMQIEEAAIPVRPQVAAACELLGIDPLYVANEGKCVVICEPAHAEQALAVLRADPLGRDAAIIGHIIDDEHRFVRMLTGFGGQRIVDWMSGEPLPRIC